MNLRHMTACAAFALVACAFDASAEIAVSVNDGKQLRAGEDPGSRTSDTLSIIDLAGGAPRVIATLAVPTSMIGPPTSVAVSPDGTLALVTAAQRLDETDGQTLVLDDTVSVVDISNPENPRVTQTLRAGPGVTGAAINKAGDLALVVSTGDDSISVFSISGGVLSPVGRLQLPYQSRPTDVAFTPDGDAALVVGQSRGRVFRLAVNGAEVVRTDVEFETGVQPYGVVVSPDGNFAFVSNLGGRLPAPDAPPAAPGAPRIGAVAVLDLASNTVADVVDVGPTPEHVSLTPDGRYLQVTVVNGSSSPPDSANYNPFGLLRIYRVAGPELNLVAEAQTGGWCQGAAWSDDGGLLLLQCAINREIEIYRFDGQSLVRDQNATLEFEGRPGAIATALSR